jgi:hypothetical protein
VLRRVVLAQPSRCVEVEPVADARGPLAQFRWQRGEQLDLGGGQHAAEPEVGGRAGQAGEEQRVRLVGRHAGEPGAISVE